MGRRILVTGVGTFWGARVAKALEGLPGVEVIVGLGTTEPVVELERTEFVRADQSYSILARMVKATQVDTIVHTSLIVNSTRASDRALHETNVIGTMNLLAAAGASESTVQQIVVKSSSLVYGSTHQDPAWFREETQRTKAPGSEVERSLLEAEGYLSDFALDSPHVTLTLLRFSNVLGTDIVTPISRALQLPLVPSIMGFDPLLQFVEEDDVVRAIEFVVGHRVPGVYNVAGDGRLPWSEVAAMCGKHLMPLPPLRTRLATAPLARLGVADLPAELLDLLRYGRGVDNRRLKQAGFAYRYSSAGAVKSFVQATRLKRIVGEPQRGYRYERDVESFFRHSPAVMRQAD